MTKVLLLPGLYDSGPEHWQSYWEREVPGATRIVQRDWDTPAREEWVEALEDAVAEAVRLAEEHGWLLGRIRDPFGHPWEIGKPLGDWPPT